MVHKYIHPNLSPPHRCLSAVFPAESDLEWKYPIHQSTEIDMFPLPKLGQYFIDQASNSFFGLFLVFVDIAGTNDETIEGLIRSSVQMLFGSTTRDNTSVWKSILISIPRVMIENRREICRRGIFDIDQDIIQFIGDSYEAHFWIKLETIWNAFSKADCTIGPATSWVRLI